MSTSSARPELAALALADPPARWDALGFAVENAMVWLGGVWVQLGIQGHGIVGWSLRGGDGAVDGLLVMPAPRARAEPARHPNGAIAVDHVVVLTPDFDRTATALEAAGMALRRQVRRADGARMGFRRLGPAILELVETPSGGDPGPAAFWGLVVVVEDLDALARRLGDRLGEVRPAVQPGRRIATLEPAGGLGQAVAFMDPEP